MADLIITTLNDEDASTTDLATETADGGGLSLREALAITNANSDADTISFNAALTGGTITLSGTQLEISHAVTINGNIDNDKTPDITVNANGQSRVFNISSTNDVTLNGLTVTGGQATGAGTTVGGGVNITNTDVSTTISNSVFTNNTANAGSAINGFKLTIDSTLVSNNSSNGGDAIRGNGTIKNSSIVSNTKTGAYSKGAIYVYQSTNPTLIENSIIAQNAGGGIFIYKSATNSNTITNSTITGNAGKQLHTESSVTLKDSVVAASGTGVTGTSLYAVYGGNITQQGTNIVSTTSSEFSNIFATQETVNNITGGQLVDNGHLKHIETAGSASSLGAQILSTNATPGVATTASHLIIAEGAVATAIDTGLTVTDSDSTTLESASITFASGFQSGSDILGFVSNSSSMGNITGSFNSTTGVLTLTSDSASATLAQWQTALRAVTYASTSDDPTSASVSRTINFTVNDGSSNSNSASRAIDLTPVNDQPTLTTTAATTTFTQGGNAVNLFSGSTFKTIETGQTINEITLTASNITDAETLTVAGQLLNLAGSEEGLVSQNSLGFGMNWKVVSANNTATITLTGPFTEANADALLNSVTYQNSSSTPTEAVRTISVTSIKDSGGTVNGGDDTNENPAITANVTVTVASTPTILTVTTLNDESASTTNFAPEIADGGGLSLREALTIANADSTANTINFDTSLSGGTITLGGSQLEITSNVWIDGDINNDRTPDITIDADGKSRVIRTTGEEVRLEGLTITGGSADQGAGIMSGSNPGTSATISRPLTIINSNISNNTVTASGSGGGLEAFNKTTIIGSTFTGNTAGHRGGGVNLYADSSIVNSTFTGNTADNGGGISSPYGAATIINTEISGNSANNTGGGIYGYVKTATIISSTITKNDAKSSGGGIGGGGRVFENSYVNLNTINGVYEPTVSVIINNVAPTTILNDSAISYSISSSASQPQALDSSATLYDSNGDADWVGGTLTAQITSGVQTTDELSISDTDGDFVTITVSGTDLIANGVDIGDISTSGGKVSGNNTLTITFDNDAAFDTVQETIRALSFSATAGTDQRTVTITATDKNSLSSTDTRTIEASASGVSKTGTSGNDTLQGADGADTLSGGDGHDSLGGEAGNDSIDGGAGDDSLQGGAGDDTIQGAEGDDSLEGGAGNDLIYAAADRDSLYGNDGDDTLVAGGDKDTLEGGAGNDSLSGDDGNDTLDGGDGDDTLNSGAGSDSLTGGMGKDTYIFETGNGDDYINDFSVTDDILDLSSIKSLSTNFRDFSTEGSHQGILGVVMTLGSGDSVFIGGASLSNLDAATITLDNKATVSGTFTGTVTEDDPTTATGTITISDADSGDNPSFSDFSAQAGNNGYGSFTLAGGTWTYTLDSSKVQSLNTGQALNDTLILTATDGTTQLINVTIHGADEASSSGGSSSGGSSSGGSSSGGSSSGGSSSGGSSSGGSSSSGSSSGGSSSGSSTSGGSSSGSSTPPVVGGNSTDTLRGGATNDTIDGGAGNDDIKGGEGDDEIKGGAGGDVIFAGEDDTGDDSVEGNSGSDIIGGGKGNDFIVGGDTGEGIFTTDAAGDDTLYGGDGNDFIVGGSYDTARGAVVDTGSGNNELWAGTGDDTVFGDSNDDVIGGGEGNDFINAGDGEDVLFGGKGDGENHDTLSGGGGSDKVFASAGQDSVDGGDGDDTLYGGTGDDTVDGGADNDEIWGGSGNDVLKGGSGSDTFGFRTGFGTDTISDFGSGDGNKDLLDFTNIEGLTLAGLLNTASFADGNTTLTVGDHGTLILTGIDQNELQALFDSSQILVPNLTT